MRITSYRLKICPLGRPSVTEYFQVFLPRWNGVIHVPMTVTKHEIYFPYDPQNNQNFFWTPLKSSVPLPQYKMKMIWTTVLYWRRNVARLVRAWRGRLLFCKTSWKNRKCFLFLKCVYICSLTSPSFNPSSSTSIYPYLCISIHSYPFLHPAIHINPPISRSINIHEVFHDQTSLPFCSYSSA